jgi:spermidine dehydrogenase
MYESRNTCNWGVKQMSAKDRDRELGMGREITRRDFLNGVSIAVGASLAANSTWLHAFRHSAIPVRSGEGSQLLPARENRHARQSRRFLGSCARLARWQGQGLGEPVDDNESYDLVIVGGGISGLAAAYFYRKFAGPKSKILLLDNHDDFGGHAKRNEFQAGKRLLLGYGGTQSIEAPGNYSKQSIGAFERTGNRPRRFFKYYDQKLFDSMHLKKPCSSIRKPLAPTAWCPRKASTISASTSPGERLPDAHRRSRPQGSAPPAACPRRLHARTYSGAETGKLIKTSYKDFLLQYAKVHPDVVKVLQTSTHDLYAVGIDAVSANDCARERISRLQGHDSPQEP